MMHGYGWNEMGAWGWVGMLVMLLFWFGFWFGLVALIVWAVRGSRAGHGPETPAGPGRDPAMTILRERLARSEITTEEFERARQTLEENRH